MTPSSALTFRTIADVGVALAASALTEAFRDYFVPMRPTADSLLNTARVDDVDFDQSYVVFDGDCVLGCALLARRDGAARIAGMGIVPEGRSRGAGRALVMRLLEDARARGDSALNLEVIEQNERALRLYEALGFERIRRLSGFEGHFTNTRAASDDARQRIEILEPRFLWTSEAPDDLPWQCSARSAQRLVPPFAALRRGPSAMVISDPTMPRIAIRAIRTSSELRKRGHARALLQGAAALFPDKDWSVNVLCPEELANLFLTAGLQRSKLTQIQMRVRL